MMRRKVSGTGARRQSQIHAPGARPARVAFWALATAVLAVGGCRPGETPAPTPTPSDPAREAEPAAVEPAAEPAAEAAAEPAAEAAGAPAIRLGIDVLLDDSIGLVAGKRVGLITNHTGLSWPGEPRPRDPAARSPHPGALTTIDRLAEHPEVTLVALYSPEHGIRGRAEAGEKVASDVDAATGLPIHSLYGETRKPTPAMLEGVEVLAFDIQDIGSRYYTYVWTMALAMEAAGEAGIPFVVLDRPNPLGGHLIQGNVLDPAYATFVGLYPVPIRHGLTAGELARMLVGAFGVDADLRVAPMEGWSRRDWYDDTGLPFVPPSPNMPSLASATHYPGTCLFEGTNLSVGRGTPVAFQQIGAPWLDAAAIAERLNAMTAGPEARLTGVRFEAVSFTPESPGDGKFGGETLPGLRFVVTDRDAYDPVRAALAALIEIQRLHGERLEWRVAHFDRLAGTAAVRQGILAGRELEAVTAGWPLHQASFETERAPYLLYR